MTGRYACENGVTKALQRKISPVLEFQLAIMQVIKPLCKNNQNIAKNFLGKWPITTWSCVTATENESWGLSISRLHGSFLPTTGALID